MANVPVMIAKPVDEAQVIATIVLAFESDPPARWMFPDREAYLANFPGFARAFGSRALTSATAYYVEDFAGVALWLPPGVQPDEAALIALLERALTADKVPQVFSILEALSQYHPAQPHWYLPMTGVNPSRQGQGYGSAMLRYALQRVDQDRLPAYLESTNPANIPLYERHGFELLGTVGVDRAPPMFPMLRNSS